VAEPWTTDLAALGTRTQWRLRSPAITRAECIHHESKPKMRFFKQHPALATLIILAILGIATPVAYAVVDRVFLSIDPNQSESDLEEDVLDQLEAQGHDNAVVTAKKTDHEYTVTIQSEDPALGNLDVEVPGDDGKTYRVHIDIPPTLPQAMQVAVGDAASKAVQRTNNESDAEIEKAIIADLTKAGLKSFTATVTGTSVSIVVKPQ
jgi:hypothetical protein